MNYYVFEVQKALKSRGWYFGEIDGDVGPKTIQGIYRLLSEAGSSRFQKWSVDRLLLASMQALIKSMGIEVGNIDGLMGPQTRYAIQVYEARKLSPKEAEKVERWRDSEDDRTLTPITLPQTVWPTQREVLKFYGEVGKNQAMLKLPRPMLIAWDKKKKINSISVHEKIHDAALRCFNRIADAYTEEQAKDLGINLFGGSLNVRKMRGGSAYSMHSWGIAIDFDPERNQLKWGKDRARLGKPDAETFWRIWEEEGALSLGRAKNYDWMHIQFARL